MLSRLLSCQVLFVCMRHFHFSATEHLVTLGRSTLGLHLDLLFGRALFRQQLPTPSF